MAEELDRIDELHAGVVAALECEGEQRPGAARIELLHPPVIGRRGQTGIGHLLHRRMRLQPGGDRLRILDMACHAQRQRLDAEHRVEGALRGHGHAEIAQADGNAVEGEGHRAEGLVELQAVIGRLGRAEAREAVTRRPVEPPAVHHDPAGHGAVAGQVFGGGMDDEGRPHLQRPAEPGGGRGVVDDERQAVRRRHRRHGRDVGDIAAGVGDALAEDRAGILVDRRLDRRQVLGVDEFRRPAEAVDGVRQLGDGAAIEPRRGDHVAARAHQREERHQLRGMAGRAGDGADAALQRRHPFLQGGDRGVGQAGIDVAHLLQVEERGGMIGVAEDIGRGLVDRDLPRACCGVRPVARMDLQGVEAERPVFGAVPGACVGHRSRLLPFSFAPEAMRGCGPGAMRRAQNGAVRDGAGCQGPSGRRPQEPGAGSGVGSSGRSALSGSSRSCSR